MPEQPEDACREALLLGGMHYVTVDTGLRKQPVHGLVQQVFVLGINRLEGQLSADVASDLAPRDTQLPRET
jgi:hypothetical protein